jgi:hypothetical protein
MLANCGIITKREGTKTLVLLDNWATLETHSIFFETLKKDGHELQFEMVKPAPNIKYFEEYYFDNIVLMAPSARGNKF